MFMYRTLNRDPLWFYLNLYIALLWYILFVSSYCWRRCSLQTDRTRLSCVPPTQVLPCRQVSACRSVQRPDSCVFPLYSLSPSACLPSFSPLSPPGARPDSSSVNLTPDVHGIVGGKLPGHPIVVSKSKYLYFLGCPQIQVWTHPSGL